MPPREIDLPSFPYPAKFHRVDGGEMAYVDVGPAAAGSGQTILCVHGNPTWSYYYRRVIERYSPSHRVVAVDHLGCGRSDRPSRRGFGYAMADHVGNLVSLIESLDLHNITLVAHDWGGAIGTAAAIATIDRIDRIMLLNTAAFPPPYIPRRIAVCRWPVVGPIAVRGFNAFARAAVPMAMNRGKLSADDAAALLAPYDGWQNRIAIDSFVRDIPMHRSHRTYATLSQLETDLPRLKNKPIGLTWGMEDWCFRPECLDRLAAVWPDALVTRIEDAGHYVLEDAPEEVLDSIDRLLSA